MRIIMTLLAITLSLTSMAAKSNDDEKIGKYFKSAEFQKQLFDLGVFWDRQILNIQTNCQSKYHLKPISFAYVKPLKFDDNSQHPIEGIWTFRYRFSRCNESIIYNAHISAQQGKQPKMAALFPGTTRASPQLLKDVYLGGLSSIVAKKSTNKQCKKTTVVDTKVTLQPTTAERDGKVIKGVWQEQWQLKHCDELIEATFCFIPETSGGTTWVIGKCAG
ncbi:MAG: hypothetical protein ISEC1_P0203 [Thiomicrorhabdus sp.]|nr:MAG: hypothetical protein ISEC1_P0203 [Thiomicrorhabdus sp.]